MGARITDIIVVPYWLYGMPEEWIESYFDLVGTHAFGVRWGYA